MDKFKGTEIASADGPAVAEVPRGRQCLQIEQESQDLRVVGGGPISGKDKQKDLCKGWLSVQKQGSKSLEVVSMVRDGFGYRVYT